MAIFSADGYFKHTPLWVKKVLMAVKGIIGTVSISTFFTGHETFAFVLLLVGAAIDELSKFIKEDEPKQDQS